jgi:acyl-coenzyme A thioesterase PaaI-like protein
MRMTPRRLRWIFNLWPPYLFAGIRVEHIAADWSAARVRMDLRWYNRNYVGTHFGGSLFAMTDPFWMLLMMEALGRDYIVWDKAGEIEFVRPGRGRVHANFRIEPGVVDALRVQADAERSVRHWFETTVCDADGEVVARVRKQLYIRRKRPAE